MKHVGEGLIPGQRVTLLDVALEKRDLLVSGKLRTGGKKSVRVATEDCNLTLSRFPQKEMMAQQCLTKESGAPGQ